MKSGKANRLVRNTRRHGVIQRRQRVSDEERANEALYFRTLETLETALFFSRRQSQMDEGQQNGQ
jgi:hypothetical protein